MRQRESAICIRASDYSETSQVVHFFTRGWGAVRLLAKGSKRPKSKSGGPIDLLCEGDLVFSASNREALGTLIEFTESVSHGELRGDSARLNTGLYIIELVGAMMSEGDPHSEVYDLLHNALARLAQDDAPVPAVLAYFQWRLLRHVGLLGDMTACVSCACPIGGDRPARNVYFSGAQGGLLCAACEGAETDKHRLEPQALAGAAALAAAEAGRKVTLPAAQADAVNKLLAYHIAYQIGRPLKMARHAIG